MRPLPPGIEVRAAGPTDMDRVDELVRGELERYREWAPDWKLGPAPAGMRERLEANFSDPARAWILIAEAGGEAVGVVSLSLTTGVAAEAPPEGTVYLWQMFVRHDWQGRGLASPLMDRAVAEARSRGFRRMVLWTPEGAAQARRFYERKGWNSTGNKDPESSFGLPLVELERSTDLA